MNAFMNPVKMLNLHTVMDSGCKLGIMDTLLKVSLHVNKTLGYVIIYYHENVLS